MQFKTDEVLNLIEAMGLPVQHVNPQRRYWFIRTQGGKYYSEFHKGEFVAIGHEDVPTLPPEDWSPEIMEQTKKSPRYAQHILKQVYSFCEEIRKDDIIIIPSKSPAKLLFGQVIDDSIYKIPPEHMSSYQCNFTRRRKVNWIKSVKKSDLDSKLYALFQPKQTVLNVDSCGEFIDRTLYPFYIKGDIAHLTLEVNIPHSPKASDISLFLSTILSQADELAAKLPMPAPTDDIQVRINVQSEGRMEFFGKLKSVMIILLTVLALFGGYIKYDPHNGFSMGTEGLPRLVKICLDHLEKMAEIENISKAQEAQERLMIKDPRDNIRDK